MIFLVVEDSPVVRRMIVNFLEANGYFSVLEAADGRQALKIMQTRVIDFLITDWLMPDIDGLQLIKIIRKFEQSKDIPILMITTKSERTDILDVVKAGANEYIVKPFSYNTFTAKIKAVLDKVNSEREEPLE